MSIVQITNHIERVILKLATQFRNKTTDQAFVGVFAAQIQVLEDALWSLLSYWDIDAAEGTHLETLGAYWQEYREEEADAAYRLRIKAKRQALSGGCSIENTLAVASVWGLDVEVFPLDHAEISGCYTVQVNDIASSLQEGQRWLRVFNSCKPAGVRINVNFYESTGVGPGWFTFDDGPGWGVGVLGQSLQ